MFLTSLTAGTFSVMLVRNSKRKLAVLQNYSVWTLPSEQLLMVRLHTDEPLSLFSVNVTP